VALGIAWYSVRRGFLPFSFHVSVPEVRFVQFVRILQCVAFHSAVACFEKNSKKHLLARIVPN
jgi:hypothetical protein